MAKGEGGKGKAIDDEIDALFQLPQSEFTAARNALASRLKKAGRADEADNVKTLPKPSLTAWAVNQLYWKHRDAFERLLAVGERFRKAQASQLSGKSADLRGSLEARRTALSEMVSLAAATLRHAGNKPTPEAMRRLTTTLETLSTYGSLPDAPRAGRLTDDVDAPGFETLAALVPTITGTGRGAGPSRVIPFQEKKKAKPPSKRKGTAEEDAQRAAEERKAQLAAAKDAVKDARQALSDARKTAQQAEGTLKKAAARAKEAEQKKAEIERRLEQANEEADAARQQARKVAAEAEEAAQAVEDAELALDKAERELKNIEEAS
jgi:hypothetical protein